MQAFDEIVAILRAVAGAYGGKVPDITPNATLEGDLRFDSVDVAATQAALAERFGPGVDLPAHLAGLDLDGIIALTVADLVRLVGADGTRATDPGDEHAGASRG